MTNERGFLICMVVASIFGFLGGLFHCMPLLIVMIIAIIWGIHEALKKDE